MRSILLACLVVLAACATSRHRPELAYSGSPGEPAPAPTVVPPPSAAVPDVAAVPVVSTRELGRSLGGRPIHLSKIGGPGGLTVMILATIHGNESAGTPFLEELLTRWRAGELSLGDARLLLVPVCNPDGLAANRRTNNHGVDLNRNFPSDNFRGTRRHGEAPLSQPESRVLHDLILQERPDVVLSFYQPLRCIDWDGPGEALARDIAAAVGLPAKKLGGRPGSLGSWVGETLGIPIVTVELPRSADRLSRGELWKRYGTMVDVVIRAMRGRDD